MKSRRLFTTLLLCTSVQAALLATAGECKVDVKKIFGKIQIVKSFPDFKVKAVNSFEDLEVKIVKSFADSTGEWQIVTSFPDYKIQIVDSFPDFTVKFDGPIPGHDCEK